MKNKEKSIRSLIQQIKDGETSDFIIDEEAIIFELNKEKTDQSLIIKILSVLGALLASVAFIGFLFITGIYDSKIALLVFGFICFMISIWINKKSDQFIMDTLSVSSYLIGYVLIGFALITWKINETQICFGFILLAFLTLNLIQNYILSFISVLIIHGSILALLLTNNHYHLIPFYLSAIALILTYFFLREASMISFSKKLFRLYSPIRIGLITSFLSGLILLVKASFFEISFHYIWICSLLIISIILYFLHQLITILKINGGLRKSAIFASSLFFLLPTLYAPALSGAILIVLLSFFVNYKTGLVIGILAFLYFIAQYYYDLNISLLQKSILLFCSGLAFLLIYLLTHKKLIGNEEV